MINVLTILINDQAVFEFDRDTGLDDQQLKFLDKIDSDMDRGLKMSGKLFERPDAEQRVRFIVMNLIKALQQDEQAIIRSSCAYLINRRPQLVEVHVKDGENSVEIELIDEQNN
ncbi:MAG: hypothetical protein OEZ38_11085 [Gammaproteobacteria bacterium]|nr:hypothetical protein [Gammaproteobacteria bacterium]